MNSSFSRFVRDIIDVDYDEEIIIKSKLLDAANDTILAHDLEGNIIYINEAACRDHGYTYEELSRITLKDLDTPKAAAMIEPRMKELLAKGHLVFESEHYRKDGSILPIEVHAKILELNGKKIVLAVNRDITERKKAEEKISYLAYRNPLTKLPNRRFFINRLKQILDKDKLENTGFALMYVDLDRFKNINDTLGHSTGDWLLISVAKRLADCLGNDLNIAHMGGDEFMILLPEVNGHEDVIKACEKILTAIEVPFYLNDLELYTATSIGVTVYPDDGQDVETLIKNADIAMYEAKRNGGSDYRLYTPKMNQESAKKFQLENGLRRALENNEFELHYQPQVDIGNGKIVGVEALLRWRNPYLGLVPPADFIPMAEVSGLIVPIGEWVLRTACTQNKAWLDEGVGPICVSVNISLRQLQHRNFLSVVRNVLQETGLEPNLLELEITESISAHNSKYVHRVISQLAELGVKISIDDFGTGYSSLVNLKHFPINTLKIDRNFIKEIAQDTKNEAIILATMALAKNLHLKVIAEGVETEAQLEFLKKVECGEMQGFLFSRPLPVAEINDLLPKKNKALLD